ncbi:MAG: hypothetical protein MPJ50_01900 [Pirellulales bacterium]|nr:hypothetical protein [Pirellulales bacterium]
MTVSFEELAGSPIIRVNEDGTQAVRHFRVAWSDWLTFARELVGEYRVVGRSFAFIPPQSFPGFENMLVRELDVEPFEPSGPDGSTVSTLTSGVNQYPSGGARVTATYEAMFDADNKPRPDLPEPPEGTFLSYKADLGSQCIATPGRTWRWDDPPDHPPLPPDIQPGVQVAEGSFELTWHRVPLPPWNLIRELRGKLNSATFVGSPPGTVLFTGAKITREFHIFRTGGFWKVRYSFLESTHELSSGALVGWNYFYKETPVSGEHWVAIADEDNNRPYVSADLTQLFTFG